MSLTKNLIKKALTAGVSLAFLSGCAGTKRTVNLPGGYSTKFEAVCYLDAISRMYCKCLPSMRLTETGFDLYFPIQNLPEQKCFTTAIKSADKNWNTKITIKEARDFYEEIKNSIEK